MEQAAASLTSKIPKPTLVATKYSLAQSDTACIYGIELQQLLKPHTNLYVFILHLQTN